MLSLRLRLTRSSPAQKNNKGSKGPAPGITNDPDESDTEPDGAEPQTNVQAKDDGFPGPSWFEKGMYIKIFAPEEKEIDEVEFIILDSRNMAGKAVRVDEITPDQLKNGSARARHAVAVMGPDEEAKNESHSINALGASTKVTQIFLDELGPGCGPPVNRYARLEHTYNIPFSGHKCQDLGFIKGPSLKRLRLQYINYLAAIWDIENDVRRPSDHVSSSQQSNGTATPGSSKASMHTLGGGSGRKTSGGS